MDERVKKLRTPEECEIFARNAEERGRPDLAKQARKRGVQLRAESHGAHLTVEKEALAAIYAYEEVRSKKKGKRTRAARTWPMLDDHGIIGTMERLVNRKSVTQGYTTLVEMGLEEYAFEAVILRHPEHFSAEVIKKAKERTTSEQT